MPHGVRSRKVVIASSRRPRGGGYNSLSPRAAVPRHDRSSFCEDLRYLTFYRAEDVTSTELFVRLGFKMERPMPTCLTPGFITPGCGAPHVPGKCPVGVACAVLSGGGGASDAAGSAGGYIHRDGVRLDLDVFIARKGPSPEREFRNKSFF